MLLKINKYIVLSILALLLSINHSLSQHTESIRGQIIHATTKEPIAFATVQLKGKAVGVITNEEGDFVIPIHYAELQNIFIVSCIGFENVEFTVSDLIKVKRNIIELSPASLDLSEAIVQAKLKRKYSARKIVKLAIDAIEENYPNQPFSCIGYYRDYQKDNNQYVNLNEAILEVFDPGFDKIDHDETMLKIYTYAVNENFKINNKSRQRYNYNTGEKVIDNAFLYDYGGNEFAILRIHDAIRNYKVKSFDFVSRMKFDLLENHTFFKDGYSYVDGEALYTIRFKNVFPNYRANGTLYISTLDYSIHKLEYTLYDNLSYAKNEAAKIHGHNRKRIFEVVSEYKRNNGKMYPNYLSFHNTFQLGDPSQFEVDGFAVDWEKNCFIIDFNSVPDKKEATSLNKYKIELSDNRIKLKTAKLIDKRVYLYPAGDATEKTEMFEKLKIAMENLDDYRDILTYEVSNMKDVFGIELYAWNRKDFDQFREFFIQEIKINSYPDSNSISLSARSPLNNYRPIVAPENLELYWMNTPLQQ